MTKTALLPTSKRRLFLVSFEETEAFKIRLILSLRNPSVLKKLIFWDYILQYLFIL